jgi:hypothetical protein
MKLFCRLFGHRFSYYVKKQPLTIGYITRDFRKCSRCSYHQKLLNDTGQWIELRKTLSEIREEKLKRLGIH